ncbi:MAG: serine hydrolase domain-containing protein [Saprospiraceae bacterium]
MKDTLTAQLSRIHQASDIPGFSVAIVSDKIVMYKNGFGYRNLTTKEPFTTETIQNIGSITKTFIAFALMKLVEDGKLELDDNIDQYIPFKITNPHFPNNSITIRQLATHTSSLTDGEDQMIIEKSYLLHEPTNFKKEDLPEDWFDYYQLYNTNKKMTIPRFLHNTYCKEGEWYSPKNFLNAAPGTMYEYTNIGATLLAHIIEIVAEKSFDKYVQEIILEPLAMEQTYWSWVEADSSDLSVGKELAGNRISHYLPGNIAVPAYDLITYPDGGLITNISDFTIYLQEMIRGLNGESKLLSLASYKEMMSNQLIPDHFPNGDFTFSRGLLWRANSQGDNISASGTDPGVVTDCMFTTGGNIGLVIFFNKSLYDDEKGEDAFRKIRQLLMKYAGKLRRE